MVMISRPLPSIAAALSARLWGSSSTIMTRTADSTAKLGGIQNLSDLIDHRCNLIRLADISIEALIQESFPITVHGIRRDANDADPLQPAITADDLYSQNPLPHH